MLHRVPFLPIFLFYMSISAQDASNDFSCISVLDSLLCKTVYTKVDSMPQPKDGLEKLHNLLVKNLVYRIDSTNTIGSRVSVGFVVEADGKISGKRIYQNIKGTDFSKQTLVLIDSLQWIPGSCNGKNVPVLFKLPINICYK